MTARRRGLGRGLDALIERKEAPVDGGFRTVPLDRLEPNRFQPRTDFDEESLRELASSIRSQGLVQPIVVTPADEGRWTIVAGERRFRAARLAGLTEVQVVVREVADSQTLLEMALVENLQRSDLNPMEEAEAYQRLAQEFGLAQAEIAKEVGKGRTTVTNALRLLRLPEEVRAMLRAGRVTVGQVRPLLGLDGEDERIRLARRIEEEGLTAREVEAIVSPRPAARRKRPRRERQTDVHTAAAEERLVAALQARVEIRRRGAGGTVRIHFHSEEELMGLYDRLVGSQEAPS